MKSSFGFLLIFQKMIALCTFVRFKSNMCRFVRKLVANEIPTSLYPFRRRLLWQKSRRANFTALSCGQLLTIKRVRHGQDHLVPDPDYKVGALGSSAELTEFLARHQRRVWPGVVLMQHNSDSVNQRWPLLDECCLQAVHLLA